MTEKRCTECGGKIGEEGEARSGPCPHCGAKCSFEAQEPAEKEKGAHLKRGEILEGFRIEERIGGGGMGEVYRATQLSLDRPVALKVLHPQHIENPRVVDLFEGETATLASLNHPNVVSIIDQGRVGETYFFAMEYVKGTTLRNVVNSRQLGIEFFLRVFVQCAEALHYVHEKGVIHRDIKLGNILLDEHKNAKIADFGLARIVAEGGAGEGKKRAFGTPGYMAPEITHSPDLADPRCDIFSLGAVMYRVLTGRLPEVLPPPPPGRFRDNIPEPLARTVLECLKVEPEDRIQTARELKDRLLDCQRELVTVRKKCPECDEEMPLSEGACLRCGADLAGMSQFCPECGERSTFEDAECWSCGRNLKEALREKAEELSVSLDRARRLAEVGKKGEAIVELDEVLKVKGEVFGLVRERAQSLRDRYRRERKARYTRPMREGKNRLEEADPEGAISIWEDIPEDVAEDLHVSRWMRTARQWMNKARNGVKKAREQLGKGNIDAADESLEEAAAKWAACPGLSDVQYRIELQRDASWDEETIPQREPEPSRDVPGAKAETLPARQTKRSWLVPVLIAALALALVGGGAWWLAGWLAQSASSGDGDKPLVAVRSHQQPDEQPGPTPSTETEEAENEPNTREPQRFYHESFDDGKAENWSFDRDVWRVRTVGRRALRALAADRRTTARHKHFQEKNCTVSAWVRLDAVENPEWSISISARHRENSQIRLDISGREGTCVARLAAYKDAKVVKQSAARTLPGTTMEAFEGRIRLDARDDRVTAQVGDTRVGELRGLTGDLAEAGSAALGAEFCRVSWDDIQLTDPRNGVAQRVPETASETPDDPVTEVPDEPAVPSLANAQPAPDVSRVGLESWSVRITQSFRQHSAGWEPGGEGWQYRRNRYGSPKKITGSAFCSVGRFADVRLTTTVRPAGGNTKGTRRGLLVRYQNAENNLFFGAVAGKENNWHLALVSRQNGQNQVKRLPGGPYLWPQNARLELGLVVVGDRACGLLEGQPVLSMSGLGGEKDRAGRVGLTLGGTGGWFGVTGVTAAGPLDIGAESGRSGLAWKVPEQVEAGPGNDNDVIRVRECAGRYVWLEGAQAPTGRMDMTVLFDDLESYPQFSICAAARGHRGPMVAQMVDFQRGGAAVVRMLGILPYRGQLKSATYGGKRFSGIDRAEPIKLSLSLQPTQARSAFAEQDVIAYSPGKIPLPEDAGYWGIRCTDLRATIQRLELSF